MSPEQNLQELSAALTKQCERLRQWHHFAAVAVLDSGGEVLAESGFTESSMRGRSHMRLVAERVFALVLAAPGEEGSLALLTPDHAWFASLERVVQHYVAASGEHELPIITDADVDRLFAKLRAERHVWVLDPTCTPWLVEETLKGRKWRVVERAGETLIFARDEGERAELTLDAESKLRVLDCTVTHEADLLRNRLVLLSPKMLRVWLTADDPEQARRAAWAAERGGELALVDWVASKINHPNAELAAAAQRALAALRAKLGGAPTLDEKHALFAARFTGSPTPLHDVFLAASLNRAALDYSLESLEAVDAYLRALHERKGELDAMDDAAFVYTLVHAGSYVGEVLRRASENEVHWVEADRYKAEFRGKTADTPAMLMDAEGRALTPMDMVAQQIRNPAANPLRARADVALERTRKIRAMRLDGRPLSADERRALEGLFDRSRQPPPPRTEARLVVKPELSFQEMARTLALIDLAPRPTPAEREPARATFHAGKNTVEYQFDSATGLRTLLIRGATAEYLCNDILNQAYLAIVSNVGELLESEHRREILLGLAAVLFLHQGRPGEYHRDRLEALQDHEDEEIRRAARAAAGNEARHS